ncbi:hypothetical protein [Halorubrum aethiopicum]|uniref:hypothetical protein n=1 Tax=Halorubrum aethiopicum TaxID=1758255 RepID=UPI0009B5A622|nr:hypothetical protein [Halorubrum aethiopicum]
MTQTANLSHPAVEVKLPLDGKHHQLVIPRDTTLFFWVALALGTQDRIPPINSQRGHSIFRTGLEIQDQLSWLVLVDEKQCPLVADSYYRKGGYKGLAWWVARDPVKLPVTVDIQLEVSGSQPVEEGDPLVLWTEHGEKIPWGKTLNSSIELVSPNSREQDFSTQREDLWKEHRVYIPQKVTDKTIRYD